MIHAVATTLRQSALAKALLVLLLWALLCIPLGSIERLVEERGASQAQAEEELGRTYSGAQTLAGPLLMLPPVSDGGAPARATVLFPQALQVEGDMQPQERYRGLFRVNFYRLEARLTARFRLDDAALAGGAAMKPGEAPLLVLAMADLRGIEDIQAAKLDGQPLDFRPGRAGLAGCTDLQNLQATLPADAVQRLRNGEAVDFAMTLRLAGQKRLGVVPAAQKTEVHLRSPWPHPSFGGRFLPVERQVGADGFDARWRISSLASAARGQWQARLQGPVAAASAAGAAACAAGDTACLAATAGTAAPCLSAGIDQLDVELMAPVDIYAMSLRAAKYGAFLVGMVLMAVALFELLQRLRLHPIQYALVGLSIALFFLLLLALSEKLPFGLAYLVAAGASVLLLGLYFGGALGSWRRGWGLGGFVALLYGALFGLLSSQNNALLLGAVLAFGMLSAVMLATRRLDWYALSAGAASSPPVPPAA